MIKGVIGRQSNWRGGCACDVTQCSFSVCLRNREESYKAVERYVDEWRAKKQKSFRCYYDTLSLDTVIVEKMYSTADVVHRSAIASHPWPSRRAPLPSYPDDRPAAARNIYRFRDMMS